MNIKEEDYYLASLFAEKKVWDGWYF